MPTCEHFIDTSLPCEMCQQIMALRIKQQSKIAKKILREIKKQTQPKQVRSDRLPKSYIGMMELLRRPIVYYRELARSEYNKNFIKRNGVVGLFFSILKPDRVLLISSHKFKDSIGTTSIKLKNEKVPEYMEGRTNINGNRILREREKPKVKKRIGFRKGGYRKGEINESNILND